MNSATWDSRGLPILEKVNASFWSLSKTAQDSFLWQMGSQTDSKHRQWSSEGHHVCREAFLRLLGVGKQRLARCSHLMHGQDLRTMKHSRCSLAYIPVWYTQRNMDPHTQTHPGLGFATKVVSARSARLCIISSCTCTGQLAKA